MTVVIMTMAVIFVPRTVRVEMDPHDFKILQPRGNA